MMIASSNIKSLMITSALCGALTLQSFDGVAAPIVCLGDSVTAGVGVSIDSPTFCDSLSGINAGVPSNDTAEALERFQTDVLSNHPSTVLIMFGLNDSLSLTPKEYRANILKMVRKLRTRGIRAILLTPNYTLREWWNPDITPYVRTLRRLKRRYSLPLLDIWKAFKNYENIAYLLDPDLAHPNEHGHHFIYTLISSQYPRLTRLAPKPLGGR